MNVYTFSLFDILGYGIETAIFEDTDPGFKGLALLESGLVAGGSRRRHFSGSGS